jgi:hypothetical protein
MIQAELDAVAATAERLYRAVSETKLVAIRRCYAPTASYADPVLGELGIGSARLVWPVIFAQMQRPLWRFAIEDVGLFSARVHSRIDFVFAATGRPVSLDVISCLGVRGGRIIRHEDGFDVGASLSMALTLRQRLALWMPGGGARLMQHARDAINPLET